MIQRLAKKIGVRSGAALVASGPTTKTAGRKAPLSGFGASRDDDNQAFIPNFSGIA
jgi:hypothetical protein